MFIKPIKRASYTLQRFSKHNDIQSTEHFRLQKRKKFSDDMKNVFQFRIITKGNPYYEIAFSNDLEQMKQNEWQYIVEEIPKKMPPNLSPKALLIWIISHFTCLGMENSDHLTDLDDDDDDLVDGEKPLNSSINEPLATTARTNDNSSAFELPVIGEYVVSSTWRLTGVVAFSLVMIFSNLLLMLLRESTSQTFYTALIALNIGLFMFIIMGIPAQVGFSVIEPYKRHKKHEKKPTHKNSDGKDEVESSDDDEEPELFTLAHATGKEDASPVTTIGFIPGRTMSASTGDIQPNSYSTPQGPSFAVRCGPNYKRNKLKTNSTTSLFDVIGLDVFRSEKKIEHIARHIDFSFFYNGSMKPAPYVSLGVKPDTVLEAALAEQAENVPEHVLKLRAANAESDNVETPSVDSDSFHFGTMEKRFMFIITMQIPTYEPAFMAKNCDGPGLQLVWYLRATEETQKDLLRSTPVCPAVRLVKGFCENADAPTPEGKKWLERMKTLPRLVNEDEFQFPWALAGPIRTYNGKPFLTRPQHRLYKGAGYANFDLDVHNFCYMAKKVVYSFLDKFERVVLDWGFTIEAYDDEEQPEVILGCIRLYKINVSKLHSWEKTVSAMQEVKTKVSPVLKSPSVINQNPSTPSDIKSK